MSLTAKTLSLAEAMALPDWPALVDSCAVDLSLVPEWFAATVGAHGIENRARVFLLLEGATPVAIVPYVERPQRLFGLSVRSRECPGSYLVANHPELISAIDPQVVIERFIADGRDRCDMIVLPNFAKGGRTANAIDAAARNLRIAMVTRPGHSSPYLTIDTQWDAFIATKDKKFRYKVRNALKPLQKIGQVVERRFEAHADTRELLEHILHIEANSWKAQAGMAISGSAVEQDYYRRLLPFLAERGALRANVLYLDGTPVAYSLAYVSNGAFRQLKTSYDEKHAALSPGFAVLQSAIHRAFECGAREFDFLGDVMAHKNQWATGVREQETFFLFPQTLRGSLVGGIASLVARIRGARARTAQT